MEIRGIRESEIDEMIDLQCRVFRPDGQERFRQYVQDDSSYQFDQTRVVVVEGRIVATLRVWDRQLRIGSRVVRMGGIGGVGTHPDFRHKGYATALMNDTAAFLRSSGYQVGVLFSEVPCHFYGRLGWASLPLSGFQVRVRHIAEPQPTNWTVGPFDEQRDLEQVAVLYREHNAQQSGSILRTREHWDTAPARIRGVLPTVVARHGEALGGYLNYRLEDKSASVLEVAYDRSHPTALLALVHHFLAVCKTQQVEQITGEVPHGHPLVDLLLEHCAGDLRLTGNGSMMLYAVNLPSLVEQLFPEWQERLDASRQKLAPLALWLETGGETVGIKLPHDGTLQTTKDDPAAVRLRLPSTLFWRAVFGETDWKRLELILHSRGITFPPEVSQVLRILFPCHDVIIWSPDHF